jgi:hypothetical protein
MFVRQREYKMTDLTVSISNVGGIDSQKISVPAGLTLISAPNASNKTSLLKAIAFGLGVDDVPIRSGATRAEVTLSLGSKGVTRTAQQNGVGTQVDGGSYFEAQRKKAQFESVAALLEFNPIRAAVRQGEDVEAPLKEPVDFESLKRRRSSFLDTKRKKSRELERLSDVDQRLAENQDLRKSESARNGLKQLWRTSKRSKNRREKSIQKLSHCVRNVLNC